ncbi:hypothetical protein L1049_000281 [Liquidambar formosana]|uniref:Uncharacterized protein n=1 Tax=Liquidambar formosana TaxID=63359 RepID=A0AAP0R593_LIQFO
MSYGKETLHNGRKLTCILGKEETDSCTHSKLCRLCVNFTVRFKPTFFYSFFLFGLSKDSKPLKRPNVRSKSLKFVHKNLERKRGDLHNRNYLLKGCPYS